MLNKFLAIILGLVFLSFTPEKISVLYRSLDPKSISEHLAFYQLFPNTQLGQRALQDAWKLLSVQTDERIPLQNIPEGAISAIVGMLTKGEGDETIALDGNQLQALAKLTARLPNRKLKGYYAKSESEVLALPAHEVDLAHGLLLSQEGDRNSSYEALIDLMALQILSKVSLQDPPERKIEAINQFIFEEMGYRFPPHSVYIKDIDLYTYLPSVIDSRKGVCLGVSILYLALSQRLDLPLEAVTPPGHIYVRYVCPEKVINIETTARGVHIDTEEYLGIETEELPLRTIKDVIGLAYYNEASVHWQNEKFETALKCYEKAALYLPDDMLLKELMGYNHLFVGNVERGRQLLEEVYAAQGNKERVAQDGVVEDFLKNRADGEAIRTLFMHVDENRASLLTKREALQKTIEKWPQFRAAYFHLGIVWMQLHRLGEALKAFQAYEMLEKGDPSAEYILCELCAVRSNYPQAWVHLHQAEELLKGRKKMPKPIKELHRALARQAPE